MTDTKGSRQSSAEKNLLREKFMEKITSMKRPDCSHHIENKHRYDEIIREVEFAKSAEKKTSLQYRRLKRYDIVRFRDKKKLIKPRSGKKNIQYFVTDDELFDVIDKAHRECGHGGRDRTTIALNNRYANVTKESINFYLDLCEPCQKRRSVPKKCRAAKTAQFMEDHPRGHIDLIDMQTSPDQEYNFVLNYQDHLTKFLILCPLRTKSAQEVSQELLAIFCTFGAPSILQAVNGREFSHSVIDELKVRWPEVSIVHGETLQSQSHEGIKSDSRAVQTLLYAWMDDNKTGRWSEGLKFCQMAKNCTFHTDIGQTPFEALFGRKERVGIQTLPDVVRKGLQTEEDLENAIMSSKDNDNTSDDNVPVLENMDTERLEAIDWPTNFDTSYEWVREKLALQIIDLLSKGVWEYIYCFWVKVTALSSKMVDVEYGIDTNGIFSAWGSIKRVDNA